MICQGSTHVKLGRHWRHITSSSCGSCLHWSDFPAIRSSYWATAYKVLPSTCWNPLERELKTGQYRPGRYTEIEIFDPKHRIVSAAPFRDRVVHHAFCAVCEPIFERGFIYDTYANRKGKGTHRAIARYETFRDRFRHVLRCDLYRYFPAIDHEILKRDLRRRIACARTQEYHRKPEQQ